MGYSFSKLVLISLILTYVVWPVVFRYSTFIQRSLLFMNYVNMQYGKNLSQPEMFGIKCSRIHRLVNLNDKQLDKIELGAWHILPQSVLSSCVSTDHDNRTSIEDSLAFSDSRPIVLYIHGNGGNRAGDHRTRLYKKLAYDFDYHVLTFDYRGFGDSTHQTPNVDGLTADAKFVYDWLLKQPNVSKDRITVWGHSLGTGVATRMVAQLPSQSKPKKLVLEAPFDSIASAIRNHPFSTPFKIMPYFEYFFVDPIKNSPEFNLDSSSNIGKIKPTKLLILHAQDDAILPIGLGRALHKRAANDLGQTNAKLYEIDAKHNLGHKFICNHDEAMAEVKSFIG